MGVFSACTQQCLCNALFFDFGANKKLFPRARALSCCYVCICRTGTTLHIMRRRRKGKIYRQTCRPIAVKSMHSKQANSGGGGGAKSQLLLCSFFHFDKNWNCVFLIDFLDSKPGLFWLNCQCLFVCLLLIWKQLAQHQNAPRHSRWHHQAGSWDGCLWLPTLLSRTTAPPCKACVSKSIHQWRPRRPGRT